MVLLVSGRMYGGGQRVVMDLKGGLAKIPGVDVEIWLLGSSPAMRGVGDAVVEYDGRYNNLATIWRTARALRQLILQKSPDFVHSHGWDADLIAFAAGGRPGTSHIIHLHVLAEWLGSLNVKQRLRRLVAKWIINRSHAVLAVSEAVRSRWTMALGLAADAIKVVPNGIDTTRFASESREAPRFGCFIIGIASRLVEGKGLEIAIEAFRSICNRGFEAKLRIAGEGPLEPKLKAFAALKGVSDRIEWLGLVTDMPTFYRSVDVYLQASLSEGMPLGLLEAMASGCPAVATAVGGTAEILRDGVEGKLVRAGDVDELANAIESMLSDKSRLRAMSEASRLRIEGHFDVSALCAELATIYRK